MNLAKASIFDKAKKTVMVRSVRDCAFGLMDTRRTYVLQQDRQSGIIVENDELSIQIDRCIELREDARIKKGRRRRRNQDFPKSIGDSMREQAMTGMVLPDLKVSNDG